MLWEQNVACRIVGRNLTSSAFRSAEGIAHPRGQRPWHRLVVLMSRCPSSTEALRIAVWQTSDIAGKESAASRTRLHFRIWPVRWGGELVKVKISYGLCVEVRAYGTSYSQWHSGQRARESFHSATPPPPACRHLSSFYF